MKTIKIVSVNSLDDIDQLVSERKRGGISFLAGGTDLMCYGRRGEDRGSLWVDLSPLDELRYITDRGDSIEIGALTTIADIAASPLVEAYLPSLARAVRLIGSPLIRNRATIGGNIGNASPAGDTIPPLYAHEARVTIREQGVSKGIRINNFFMGPKMSILHRGEFITSINAPKHENVLGSFLKLGQRNSLRIAKVSLAVVLQHESNQIKDIRIAPGAMGPTVFRAYRTENQLRGKTIHADLIREAQMEICEECMPIDDVRSTADYRRAMLPMLLERILLDDLLPQMSREEEMP